jgi:hypothetical protein
MTTTPRPPLSLWLAGLAAFAVFYGFCIITGN